MGPSTSRGTPIQFHKTLPSTNAEAMRIGNQGSVPPVWVVAECQTAGRGRSGRTWVSPSGNLFASLLIKTKADITALHQLSLVTGVAVFNAVQSMSSSRIETLRLKWPNDLLAGRSKTGGILVESTTAPEGSGYLAVLGIGLNVLANPEVEGRPDVTCLAGLGVEISPEQAIDHLDRELHAALNVWDDSAGFPAIRAAWLERCGPIGEPITVQANDGPLMGTFAGLDDDGALLFDIKGGERRRCTYGDVTLA